MKTRDLWIERYQQLRAETERLAAPLSAEDQQLQASPDSSPTKWHQGHTTWFFETFLLPEVNNKQLSYLFNSYYEALGPRHPRPHRGLISRPNLQEVQAYRREVDSRVVERLSSMTDEQIKEIEPIIALGIAHEEQHQELILTDILAAFAVHPFHPVYMARPTLPQGQSEGSCRTDFISFEGGLVTIGATSGTPFYFDNEGPPHQVFLRPYALCSHPILVRDVLAFIEAKGYQTPSLWLSDGWGFVQQHHILSPNYSFVEGGELWVFTLNGLCKASPDEPVGHLSYYEADELARFLGGRLPTEAEWESAARGQPVEGQFREKNYFEPKLSSGPLRSLYGSIWEWTSSAYHAYPGYSPSSGALGEYNGKFMVNQMVLRGGSCFSNRSHLRASYRNFWHPHTRFQMTGARVARDI
jgi:ergothioneine biosynthesis protein EgtB